MARSGDEQAAERVVDALEPGAVVREAEARGWEVEVRPAWLVLRRGQVWCEVGRATGQLRQLRKLTWGRVMVARDVALTVGLYPVAPAALLRRALAVAEAFSFLDAEAVGAEALRGGPRSALEQAGASAVMGD